MFFTIHGNNNTLLGNAAGNGNGAGYSYSNNTLVGNGAGGTITTTGDNVAVGNLALTLQTWPNSGTSYSTYNVALGNSALYTNNPTSTTNGYLNVAVGYSAGYYNTIGSRNIFIGDWTGQYNTTGINNTSLGYKAGQNNSTSSNNTCLGYIAGWQNTGIGNSFVGFEAGYSNTSGKHNTAVGDSAGFTIAAGDSNTFVGYRADANASNLHNCAAFGYGTTVTANDKMFFGNTKIIGCYNSTGTWGAYSDGRFKFNVKEEVKGLDFIKKLRPVTYQLDTKKLDEFIRPEYRDSLGNIIPDTSPQGDYSASTNRIHSGFIAQEVEQAANACGFKSTIVSAPSNSKDPYALNYMEFVVPLVKAVQEQQKMIDSLKQHQKTTDSLFVQQKNTDSLLIEKVNSLLDAVSKCCSQGSTGSNNRVNNNSNNNNGNGDSGSNNSNEKKHSNVETTLSVELASKSAILYQNMPNPFGDGTVVKYFVPENSMGATIIFFDEFGNEIKNVELPNKGITSELNLATMNLASGIYSYSMMVNGKVVDTKKMMKAK